jgi:hypothetical protein
MRLRPVTIAVCVLDTIAAVFIAFATFYSESDPAAKGLDQAAGGAVTALFTVTGAPALALTALRRAPRTALVLALAFPVVVVLLFVAAIVLW